MSKFRSNKQRIVYFDTNLYKYIVECGEVPFVADMLRKHKLKLLASLSNLTELLANPNEDQMFKEVKSLRAISDFHEEIPQPYLHAKEVLMAISRLRPKWLRPLIDRRQIDYYLKEKRLLWARVRRSDYPVDDPPFLAYRHTAETGISEIRNLQRTIRSELLKGNNLWEMRIQRKSINIDLEQSVVPVDWDDPEIWWRTDCMATWFESLVRLQPALRDYNDFLSPYVDAEKFIGDDYSQFWMKDVKAKWVPRNRLMALAGFYQLKRKITHGNAEDLNHASHLLDVDYFLTADKSFYGVLQDVTRHFDKSGSPVLINRSAASAVEEIARAIREA